MRFGILALDYLPAMGGMERLAAMHVDHLSRRHEIVVHVKEAPGISHTAPVRYEAGLCGELRIDLPRLKAERVDAWLICNAGLASYIPHLPAPSVAMVHGNDFLRPWMPVLPLASAAIATLVRRGMGYRAVQAFERRARRGLIAKGLHAAARIIACSRFTAGAVQPLTGRPVGQINVIHPCLDHAWLSRQPAPQRAATGAPLNLLSVARLTTFNQRKNIEGVLRALALLKDDLSFSYTVIGEGDDLDRLKALSGQLGLAQSVRFLGRVSDEGLLQAYAQTDLFVLTVRESPDDVEGFGMVYSEAAALGIPSLATRFGGVADAVADGATGLLLNDGEPATIAQGLRQFAKSRDAFDPAAIRAFAETFRIETIGPRLEQVLIEAAA